MYDRYAELRDKKGLSDYAVAKAAGLGRSTLSDWKTGKHIPNRDNLRKIADYFGVSMEYLMGKEDAIPVRIISDFEYQIILKYRQLSSTEQSMLLRSIGLEEKKGQDALEDGA